MDYGYGLSNAVVFSLPLGLALGLAGGLAVGVESGVDAGTGVGVLAGSASGLSIGFAAAFTRSAWPRYVLTVWASRRRDELPRRLTGFVDWAYGAGLLRLSGTAIQFRHRDLQTHLVDEV